MMLSMLLGPLAKISPKVRYFLQMVCREGVVKKKLNSELAHCFSPLYCVSGVTKKRCVKTSGMQTNAIKYLLNKFNGSKFQKY